MPSLSTGYRCKCWKEKVSGAVEAECDSRDDAELLQEVEFFFFFFPHHCCSGCFLIGAFPARCRRHFLRQCRNAAAALTPRLYLRPHRGCSLPPPPPPRPEALKRALNGKRGTSEISQATGGLWIIHSQPATRCHVATGGRVGGGDLTCKGVRLFIYRSAVLPCVYLHVGLFSSSCCCWRLNGFCCVILDVNKYLFDCCTTFLRNLRLFGIFRCVGFFCYFLFSDLIRFSETNTF